MSAKKPGGKPVNVCFKIVLEVGMDIGSLTLEDALVKARAMKVDEVLDLNGLDLNDSSIEVYSLYQETPPI